MLVRRKQRKDPIKRPHPRDDANARVVLEEDANSSLDRPTRRPPTASGEFELMPSSRRTLAKPPPRTKRRESI